MARRAGKTQSGGTAKPSGAAERPGERWPEAEPPGPELLGPEWPGEEPLDDGEVTLPAILPLTNDIVFKGTFGVPECARSLAAFLKALCPWLPWEDLESITLVDTRRKRRHPEDKECVLDVNVALKSGQAVAIEMQMYSSPVLTNRAQYYNARMMAETLAKGGQYGDIPRVVTVFILGERLFGGNPSYRHEYRLLDMVTKEELPNSQVILFLELPNLPLESDGTAAWLWLRLFGARTREELEAFVREEPAMSELAVRVLEMSSDKRARLMAISREKWRRDHSAILHEAKTAHSRGLAEGRVEGLAEGRVEGLAEGAAKGRVEGLAEGEAKGRVEVARRMLAKGLSAADITGLTGLTAAEVGRLRRE